MNKEFLPYDLSLAMKELGFGEMNIYAVYYNGQFHEHGVPNSVLDRKEDCAAPLFQQAFRWFRENCFLYSNFNTVCNANEVLGVDCTITSWRMAPVIVGTFFTQEEAELACIRELIKICQNDGRRSEKEDT